jgi:2-keto-4-pentenoate hydratase/2-oxohepta-3-ene-1,7-dioic acid hydratase in catechol pathway
VALPGALGRLEKDGSVAELDLPHPTWDAYLRDGGQLADVTRTPARRRVPFEEAEEAWGDEGRGRVAPRSLSAQATVWGVGLNYRSKQVATGRPQPQHPTLYIKAPTAFGGRAGASIPLPLHAPDCVDYEGEIAAVVGRPLYQATAVDAATAVAAVVAANDVTARDVLRSTANPSLAKSFPGFGQLGRVFADPASLGGLDDITVSTSVNGERRQADSSAGLLLGVGELLALISRYALLRPGDVVLTGTPAGTGDESATYLQPGDVVHVAIGDLPPLTSTVVATL